MQIAVVVPSNRELTREFLDPIASSTIIYLVNDSDEDIPVANCNSSLIRLNRDRQDSWFKNEYQRNIFMSRGTAGCRNVGILEAYHDGADIIINLDDDVIMSHGFEAVYEYILSDTHRFDSVTSNRKWFNTVGGNKFFARGIPYQDRVGYEEGIESSIYPKLHPRVHMGLWRNILDINGMDKLDESVELPNISEWDDGKHIWLPYQSYIPLCGMNCAARRDSVMGLLQIPMGLEFYPRNKMFRIEDIWGGYLWQSLYPNTTVFGQPVGFHQKKGNTLWETRVENYANIAAKDFEKAIDDCMVGIIQREDQTWSYHDLAYHLDRYASGVMQFEGPNDKCPDYFREFVYKLSRTMDCWARMFGYEGF